MTPLLSWPGGKRWLVARHSHLLPPTFRTYREPFLGSGAVYFRLEPRAAVLSDTNPGLIAAYRAIRTDPGGVVRRLRRHQTRHDSEHYYRTRDARPTADRLTEAARFIYLNRTCFNGIYRVNKWGLFNVPMGTKTSVVLPTDDFLAAIRLRRVRLEAWKFEWRSSAAPLRLEPSPPAVLTQEGGGRGVL